MDQFSYEVCVSAQVNNREKDLGLGRKEPDREKDARGSNNLHSPDIARAPALATALSVPFWAEALDERRNYCRGRELAHGVGVASGSRSRKQEVAHPPCPAAAVREAGGARGGASPACE